MLNNNRIPATAPVLDRSDVRAKERKHGQEFGKSYLRYNLQMDKETEDKGFYPDNCIIIRSCIFLSYRAPLAGLKFIHVCYIFQLQKIPICRSLFPPICLCK